MNKAHRDRLAFMRSSCSGKFERDTEYYHVQSGKKTAAEVSPRP